MSNEEMLLQIPHANLYQMLGYSFRDLRSMTVDDMGEETFEQVEQLLSVILRQGITRQLRRGLYKEYVEEEGLLQVLRGKIDMHETLRLKTQISRQIYCHYDEFSINNLYNQLLKAFCLLILQRERLPAKELKYFKRLLLSFQEVDEISLDSVAWKKLSYEKNKFSYKMLIQIGYIIFRGLQIDPYTGKSTLSTKTFNQLYKQFVYCFFETECEGVEVSYEKRADEEEVDSDLLLMRENKRMLVHTCFYPELFTSKQNNFQKSFLLQELRQTFYSVMAQSKKLGSQMSGLLLYPSIEEAFTEAYVLEGHQIYVGTIDLRVPMESIKLRLRQMSELT